MAENFQTVSPRTPVNRGQGEGPELLCSGPLMPIVGRLPLGCPYLTIHLLEKRLALLVELLVVGAALFGQNRVGTACKNASLMLEHYGMASTSNTRTLSSNSSRPLYRVRFRTTLVPRPGSLRKHRSPLRRLALSCIPLIPFPPEVADGFSAGSNPRPSSATSTRSLLS